MANLKTETVDQDDKVQVLVYLVLEDKKGRKDEEVLDVSENSSPSEFVDFVVSSFGERITGKFNCISLKKYSSKFNQYITVKVCDSSFIKDGDMFEVSPIFSDEQSSVRLFPLAKTNQLKPIGHTVINVTNHLPMPASEHFRAVQNFIQNSKTPQYRMPLSTLPSVPPLFLQSLGAPRVKRTAFQPAPARRNASSMELRQERNASGARNGTRFGLIAERFPLPINQEESIELMLKHCRYERSGGKQVEMVRSILGIYDLKGVDVAAMIKVDFEKRIKLELRDQTVAYYDYEFAENFQDFWSYGFLIWGIDAIADSLDPLSLWNMDTETRCNIALQVIGLHCPQASLKLVDKMVIEAQDTHTLNRFGSETQKDGSKIFCCSGDYFIGICGQLIPVIGGLADAISLFVLVHSYFALSFPNAYKDLLFVVSVLMGLPLPSYYELSAIQINMIEGAYGVIQKEVFTNETTRSKENMKWKPHLMENRVSDGVGSLYK